MGHPNLQNRLKELYVIPRQIMSSNLDLENCPHCGHLDVVDSVCNICEKQSDCFWLYKNDQFSSKATKPLWQEKIALDFAIDFIGVKVEQWEHEEGICECYVCEWLRYARDISVELNETVKFLL